MMQIGHYLSHEHRSATSAVIAGRYQVERRREGQIPEEKHGTLVLNHKDYTSLHTVNAPEIQ
jgi:hypothetical protein